MECKDSNLIITGYNKGEYTEVLTIWNKGKVTLTPIEAGPFTLTLRCYCCCKARATLINSDIYYSLDKMTCHLEP